MSRSFFALPRLALVAAVVLAMIATTIAPQPAAAAESSDGRGQMQLGGERSEGETGTGPSTTTTAGEGSAGKPVEPDLAWVAVETTGCDVTFTYENVGAVPSAATTIEWTDTDGSVYTLALGALAAGGSQTFTITTTPSAVGFNLIVEADPANSVIESDETNNGINYGISADCDQYLVLELVSMTFLADCSVEIVIANVGTIDFTGAGDVYVQSSSGGFEVLTIPVPLTAAAAAIVTAGPWTPGEVLDIYLDPLGAIAGSAFWADTTIIGVTVPAVCGGDPDLVAVGASVVACDVTFTFENVGDAASDATLIEWTDSDGAVYTLPLGALAPGGSATFTITTTPDPAGFTVVVVADPANSVGESDETNNTIDVVVGPDCDQTTSVGDPDLEMTAYILDCVLYYEVTNVGTGDAPNPINVLVSLPNNPNPTFTLAPNLVAGATESGSLTLGGAGGNVVVATTGGLTNEIGLANNAVFLTAPDCGLDVALTSVTFNADCTAVFEMANIGFEDVGTLTYEFWIDGVSTGITTTTPPTLIGATATGLIPAFTGATVLAVNISAGANSDFDLSNNWIELTIPPCGLDVGLVSVTFNADCSAEFEMTNLGLTAVGTLTYDVLVDGLSVGSASTTPTVSGGSATGSTPIITSGPTVTIMVTSGAAGDVDLTNNTITVPVPVGCIPNMELAVVGATFNPADCTVTFEVANLGDVDLTALMTAAWSLNGTNAGGTVLTGLPAGTSTFITTSAFTVGGNVLVEILPANSIGDIDATNNSLLLSLPNCLPEPPVVNLTVTSVVDVYSCTVTVTVMLDGPAQASVDDPFVVTIGNTDYTVGGPLVPGDSVSYTFGPTFTAPSYDITVDVNDDVNETDETDNVDSFVVDVDCLPTIIPECFDQYVLITRGNDDNRIYKLDGTGNIEWDYGTVPGLSNISEIAWAGDALYATDGAVLYEVTLDTAGNTAAGVMNGLPSTTAMSTWGPLLLVADGSNVHWIDPVSGTTGWQYAVPDVADPTLTEQYMRALAVDHVTGTVQHSLYASETVAGLTAVHEVWLDTASDGTSPAELVVPLNTSPPMHALSDTGAGVAGFSAYGDAWDLDVGSGATQLTAPADTITRVASASAYTDGCIDDFIPVLTMVTNDKPGNGMSIVTESLGKPNGNMLAAGSVTIESETGGNSSADNDDVSDTDDSSDNGSSDDEPTDDGSSDAEVASGSGEGGPALNSPDKVVDRSHEIRRGGRTGRN